MTLPFDLVALVEGRSLCHSPKWDCSEFGLVFDRNSGDYWIVSELSVQALLTLESHNALAFSELVHVLGPQSSYFDIENALKLTLQSLVDNGIVKPVHWSSPPHVTLYEPDD